MGQLLSSLNHGRVFDSIKYFLAYTLSIRVVERFEFYNVRVADNAHDLQLTILLPLVSPEDPCGMVSMSTLKRLS